MKKTRALWVMAGLIFTGVMVASAVPVFEYSFPASYDGTVTTITDLSGVDNHAALFSSTSGGIVDDRPAVFDASLMSLTGSTGGHGRTDAIDLLNSTDVAANGGFTMDVWFKWPGNYTNIRKLIDYAGTENLRTQDSQIRFGLSNSGTVLAHDIVAGQWYHAVATFDTTGYTAEEDPTYTGEYMIMGDAKLFIDGVLVDSADGVLKSGQGDSLDRSIALNMWPQGGDWNQGMIFNPKVHLGMIVTDPAPPLWIQDPFECSTGIVGVAYNDTLSNKAYDPNGDPITFSLIDTGTWLNVATNGAMTNNRPLLVGDIGTHSFQVIADDQISGSSTGTLNIVVRDTLSPVWNEDPVRGALGTVGVEYTGTLDGKAYDPDGESIEYSKGTGPDWLIIANDGTFSGAPTNSYIGENTFSVVADDGHDPTTSATLIIQVRDDLRTISINFAQGGNQPFSGGNAIGPLEIDSGNWNNTLGRDSGELPAGTMTGLIDDKGVNSGADITWTASAVNWNWDGTGSDQARLSVGYLEDGEPGVSITLTDIPYEQYRVYGLLSTRQNNTGLYEALNCYVNGTLVFGGDETTTMPAYGGINANTASNEFPWSAISGSVTGNYWTVVSSGSTLTIDGLPQNGEQRGSISGLIIENLSDVPGGAVSDLMITGPVDGGVGMELSWTGEDGKSYGVETNSNLIVGDWQTYRAGIMGDGGMITITNMIGPDQTFYRVISE